MEHNVHTVKVTGHLTFESKHANFRSAFRDFLDSDESVQLQITDMINTDLPSMEIGARIELTREISSVVSTRFAKPDSSKPQRIEPKKIVVPVDSENPSDSCFY